MRISKSVSVRRALIVMVARGDVQPTAGHSASVLIVAPLLPFLAMGGSHAPYRATKEFYLYGGARRRASP